MSDVIDELRRQLVGKDATISRKDQELGDIRRQLEERNKIILILKVRSRIEELEKKFLTQYMLNNDTRRQKWDTILNHQGRRFRNNQQLQQFRASITIPYDIFIDTVVSLYGDFLDVAAHKVLFSVPYTRSAIEQMFRDIGLVPDVAKVRTVEAIMAPINLP